jgi:hypothetical protein
MITRTRILRRITIAEPAARPRYLVLLFAASCLIYAALLRHG